MLETSIHKMSLMIVILKLLPGAPLLTWFNLNPCMDK